MGWQGQPWEGGSGASKSHSFPPVSLFLGSVHHFNLGRRIPGFDYGPDGFGTGLTPLHLSDDGEGGTFHFHDPPPPYTAYKYPDMDQPDDPPPPYEASINQDSVFYDPAGACPPSPPPERGNMELSSDQECRGRTVGFPGIWGPAFPSGCFLSLTLGSFSRLPPQKALGPSLLRVLRIHGQHPSLLLLVAGQLSGPQLFSVKQWGPVQ